MWAAPCPQAANLKTDFGAKGDGVTDDTAALLKALDTVQKGAFLLPAGVCVCVVVWARVC